jgi:hypothetical protein
VPPPLAARTELTRAELRCGACVPRKPRRRSTRPRRRRRDGIPALIAEIGRARGRLSAPRRVS